MSLKPQISKREIKHFLNIVYHIYLCTCVFLVTVTLLSLLIFGGTIKFNFDKFNPVFEKIDNILK